MKKPSFLPLLYLVIALVLLTRVGNHISPVDASITLAALDSDNDGVGDACDPTLITLTSFTAAPSDRKIILEWTTASEIDNAGFNVYRAKSEYGEYVKINSSLIPAQGTSTSGATYQYVDSGVKNRTTYYYKLEDIDLSGKSTFHGPVSAVPRVIYGTGRQVRL